MTKLFSNIIFALSLLPVLWYFSYFSSILFHVLSTIILLVLLAIKFSPPWPDPYMDSITAAIINKERFFPKNTPTHLSLVTFFEDCPKREEVVKSMRILLQYERFTSIPVPALNAFESSWRNVPTNIEDFVFQYDVEDIEKEINGLTLGTLRPLDPTRPQWRVDILQAKGQSAVVWLVDHSIGDGIGLLPVALGLMTREDGTPYVYDGFKPKKTKQKQRSLLSVLMTVMADIKEILTLSIGPFDSSCGLNRNANNKELSYNGKRIIATIPDFELEQILIIKNSLGGDFTVNDVFTACWAGALRRYLLKINDPIMKTPEKILIRGLAPVSLPRPTIAGKVYCKFVFAPFHFPIAASSARERLHQVHSEFSSFRTSIKIPLTKLIIDVAFKLGFDKFMAKSNNDIFHRISFVFSNVPGPLEPLRMFGKAIVGIKPYYCNLINQAIFFSYAGKVSLAMVLDYGNVEKPELIGSCFLEELEDMRMEFVK